MSVSVIIPACNAESSLAASLDSVLAQTFAPYEVFVINDGSTDRTAEIARGYGDRIIYREQENAGQGAARNVGLAEATGDYIAFLDADDYWKPGFLEATVSFLEDHPEAIAVSCASATRYADGHEQVGPPCIADGSGPKTPVVLEDFYPFWAAQDHVRTGTALIRHDVIKKAGGQRGDLRVSQDLEYWGYIATFGKWGVVPEPLWVGNSRTAARTAGWLQKYRKRRRLCPTVELWQERILPRLTDEQTPWFEIVRGRVAAGYAQNMVLAGRRGEALAVVIRYGDSLPRNRMTNVMRSGARMGRVGWLAACAVIRARERCKAWQISRGCKRTTKHTK